MSTEQQRDAETENVNMNGASAQTDGIFVPSKEWQDVPDWAAMPNGGKYEMNLETGRNRVRWDNPPGPEAVVDKRTGKPQTAGTSQKVDTEHEQKREDSTQISAKELAETVTGDPLSRYMQTLKDTLGEDRAIEYLTDSTYGPPTVSSSEIARSVIIDGDIEAMLNDALRFPDELIPDKLRPYVEGFARYSKMPLSASFLLVVSMLSAALGKGIRIESKEGRFTAGNLYALLFSHSGTGKSELFNKVIKPLLERNKLELERFNEEEKPDIDFEIAEVKRKIEILLKKGGDLSATKEERKQLNREIASLEKQLQPPQIVTEDVTPEALEVALSRSNSVITGASSEALKAIQNLKGHYSKGAIEDNLYNKGFSLESKQSSRVSRDSVNLDEICISIIWITQPDKVSEIYKDGRIVGGGFAPRCLALNEFAESQYVTWSGNSIDSYLEGQWDQLWNAIYDAFRSPKSGQRVNVCTEPDAQAAMVGYTNFCVDMSNRVHRDIREFPNRWAEIAWKLSLIFHVAKYETNASKVKMSRDTVDRAVAFMRYFADRQVRLLRDGRKSAEENEADRLYEICDSKGGLVTLGILKKNHNIDEENARRIVGLSAGRLEIVSKATTAKGGKPTLVVQIANKAS